ncbi:hypothetical protein GO730_00660 [Spirosoma sp. HMF3257]|uniref:Uncharacterized protein n=1 Tax=Spirosoma telluris TaxID=2183553 RepID=A0A327NDF6_9BACT|nr:hypothetical protein [Spirosoma telluris]RAI73311.1 hypothetical protein HMF3257_00645 [Spirosoma telluris]
MTLDAIIDRYEDGTLAAEPDAVLLAAQAKVETWHAWRHDNPTARPSAVPSVEVLSNISAFIQTTTNNRYGCND